MKITFICFLLFYLITFSNSTITCKDDRTNSEYIAEDSDIPERFTNLSRSFELKMNEITKNLDEKVKISIHNMEMNIARKLEVYLDNLGLRQLMHEFAKISEIEKQITLLNHQFTSPSSPHALKMSSLEKRLNILTTQLDAQLNGQKHNFMETLNEDLKNALELKTAQITNDLEKRLGTLNTHINKLEELVIRTLTPTNCREATKYTQRSGIYKIQCVAYSPEVFEVVCDAENYGGGWTVVTRRFDGSVDFYRNWNDYKIGFGQLSGEFFIGLDKLHAMTSSYPKQELLIILKNSSVTKYAKYDSFVIGNEDQAYILNELGAYSGNASNAFKHQLGQKFTTKDRDNDASEAKNCAILYTGAWWFEKCYFCHLFGKYLKDDSDDGIHWSLFAPNYTNLQFAEMLIRPAT